MKKALRLYRTKSVRLFVRYCLKYCYRTCGDMLIDHRRVIAACITGEPMPEVPEWHKKHCKHCCKE